MHKVNKIYPFLFHPNIKQLVWGTEDWTLSAISGSESVVENGCWAGHLITEVIEHMPEAILGRSVARKASKYLPHIPIMTKIITSHDDLSIQVHPDDVMALHEHEKLGKSEMWYVLEAEPDAYLYAGFKKELTQEEFTHLVQDSLTCRDLHGENNLISVLAKHRVCSGDVFYLPAGRVHAICKGIRLIEVQQTSDVTYRLFDYNRLGLDGRPRELHTELATRALDFTVYPEYRTLHKEKSDTLDRVLDTPYFSIRILQTDNPFHRNLVKYDSFIIIICLSDSCLVRIRTTQQEVVLSKERTCLIPAAIADYDIVPMTNSTKVLETYINNRSSFKNFISNFWHSTH